MHCNRRFGALATRNVPNHYTTSVRPSVRPSVCTQRAAEQVVMKSNIWEFHEKLSAYCAGFGHNHTGTRTSSRDPSTLCCISSGSGSVTIGAKSGAEVAHRNICLVLSITLFPHVLCFIDTISCRYVMLSVPNPLTCQQHRLAQVTGHYRLAKEHSGPTVPHTGAYWAHRS